LVAAAVAGLPERQSRVVRLADSTAPMQRFKMTSE
jgi:hypothetical protein